MGKGSIVSYVLGCQVIFICCLKDASNCWAVTVCSFQLGVFYSSDLWVSARSLCLDCL